MLPSTRYVIASQFSKFPGGRKRVHGRHSGEEFREDIVRALLAQYERVTFDLSGSAGYSSGFLDEAFGGLLAYFTFDDLRKRVVIEAEDDPDAIDIAWKRMREASRERA
ncbi:STAS-like domain-containing protein [Xanthomonas citri]|uniref:STAS-like domain-containing protein n=1 Tax=Xanthomonas citri TaxID=346 RepID=UPI0005B471BC|nr:STAS-like domain-containing protein [Xanthomonas citri]AMU99422.1 hypothetical protein TP37_16020 [Xanthomonas citri pv. aurantifolii]TBW93088.1 hypothetical protein TP49_22790 [Xanthomonas citri pv. aurantifolii]TBW97277.1 hypothetical protein TP47_11960 [Xanthomonas citri pv. aurantifolii]TBX03756.1 hypothetical protein TP46_09430 [Xanthomonas citri pv. aurantifolii]